MANMTIERLHQLFEDNPQEEILSWQGLCHDCRREIEVTAVPQEDGIHIEGGAVYEPEQGRFFLKCDGCLRRDAVLRNYQDCEVYSRVVGYLRPVTQWNDGKRMEFEDRKVFDRSVR